MKPCWWLVQSESYNAGGCAWYEPPEMVADVAFVFTATKNRARVLAVKWWRMMVRTKRQQFETVTCGDNPFRKLRVEKYEDRCEVCGKYIMAHTQEMVDACSGQELEP